MAPLVVPEQNREEQHDFVDAPIQDMEESEYEPPNPMLEDSTPLQLRSGSMLKIDNLQLGFLLMNMS